MEEFTAIINAFSKLAWPILIGIVILKLWPLVRNIIESRDFKIKYGDAELSVQDASDQLRRQIEDLQNQIVLQSAQELPTSKPIEKTDISNQKTILWVDDKPRNNAYEVAKLKEDGFQVKQVKSTAEALSIIEGGDIPGVIISDMGRNEAGSYVADAGLQLINELKVREVDAPIFIYTTKRYAQKHHDQCLEAGGNGATSSPLALFKMISQVI